MTEFTASNGVTLHSHDSRMDVNCSGSAHPDGHKLSVKETEALREFFQHEGDKERGRWRWAENPDYVVYPRARGVLVLSESTGVELRAERGQYKGGEVTVFGAAAAYFEAHPERKPWDAAAAGELWAFTTDPGQRETLWERDSSEMGWHLPGQKNAELGVHFAIVTGRRIWPEEAS